jgi:hypothetical protein
LAHGLELAARNEAERSPFRIAKVLVGIVKRVERQSGPIVVWINRVNRNIFGANRTIRREGKSDDFVEANPRASERMVDALDYAGGAGLLRRIPDGGLFHGIAYLAQTNNLACVSDAAAQLFLRPGATGCESSGQGNQRQKRKNISHKNQLLTEDYARLPNCKGFCTAKWKKICRPGWYPAGERLS